MRFHILLFPILPVGNFRFPILSFLGEMLKFLGCLVVALGAVLSIPMEMTTMRPEATTEDTSGRLLSLPDPVKCAQSESTLVV